LMESPIVMLSTGFHMMPDKLLSRLACQYLTNSCGSTLEWYRLDPTYHCWREFKPLVG